MKTNSLNIKQFPAWVVNIHVQMLCFSYVAFFLCCIPFSNYSKGDLSFNNFEKLLLLLGFLRDIGRVGEGLLRARISP